MLFLDYSNLQERRIISKLRRCYIRRNISGMSRRHHIRKFCFSDVFPKWRFHWKVEIISAFQLGTNVFFWNQSFLCIHVSKGSHYNMAYVQSTIQLKSKMAAYFNLENNETWKELSVSMFNMTSQSCSSSKIAGEAKVLKNCRVPWLAEEKKF